MKNILLKKVNILFIILVFILSILISCNKPYTTLDKAMEIAESSKDQTDVSQMQQIEDDSEYEAKEKRADLNWKTDEIFDSAKYSDKLSVRFFHTGVSIEGSSKEGDLILVTAPDGTNMLIDAGMPECGPILLEFLERLNVKKLDYAIGTHMHIDHIGGYVDILNSINVDRMILPNFINYNTSTTNSFLTILDAKRIPVEIVKKGDTFKLGDDIDIEILSPEWNIVVPDGTIPEESAGFVNNHSLVIKITYKENAFLFAGDIYWEREEILVKEQLEKLNADVLKVPHHGASTSSFTNFVDAVKPEIAIMTSEFPDKGVYDKYKARGSDIYITGLDGNILVISDGNNIKVIQEHDRTIQNYYD